MKAVANFGRHVSDEDFLDLAAANGHTRVHGNLAELLREGLKNGSTFMGSRAEATHPHDQLQMPMKRDGSNSTMVQQSDYSAAVKSPIDDAVVNKPRRPSNPFTRTSISVGDDSAGGGVPLWKVVAPNGLKVRERPDKDARTLASKPVGQLVAAYEQDGWIRLTDEPGFMLMFNGSRALLERMPQPQSGKSSPSGWSDPEPLDSPPPLVTQPLSPEKRLSKVPKFGKQNSDELGDAAAGNATELKTPALKTSRSGGDSPDFGSPLSSPVSRTTSKTRLSLSTQLAHELVDDELLTAGYGEHKALATRLSKLKRQEEAELSRQEPLQRLEERNRQEEAELSRQELLQRLEDLRQLLVQERDRAKREMEALRRFVDDRQDLVQEALKHAALAAQPRAEDAKRLEAALAEAQNAKIEAQDARNETEMARSEAEQAREQARSEMDQRARIHSARYEAAQVEAENARSDAEEARMEAEEARSDAEILRTEAEKARKEVHLARSEAEKAWNEVEKAKSEALNALREAENAHSEAVAARSETQQLRLELENIHKQSAEVKEKTSRNDWQWSFIVRNLQLGMMRHLVVEGFRERAAMLPSMSGLRSHERVCWRWALLVRHAGQHLLFKAAGQILHEAADALHTDRNAAIARQNAMWRWAVLARQVGRSALSFRSGLREGKTFMNAKLRESRRIMEAKLQAAEERCRLHARHALSAHELMHEEARIRAGRCRGVSPRNGHLDRWLSGFERAGVGHLENAREVLDAKSTGLT